MARYHVATEWNVAAPGARVWDAILLYRDWPTWWRGFRSVELLRDGDDRGVGTVLRQSWRSRLPYTLTFDLEITGVQQKRRLEGRASGDVEGTATWTFDERDGETRVCFVLDVTPARWWMRIPVPFAGRIFTWNFDTVMRWGSEGLAGMLDVGVAHRTAPARLATA